MTNLFVEENMGNWKEFLIQVDALRFDGKNEKEIAKILAEGSTVNLRKAISEFRKIQWICNVGAYMNLKREGYGRKEICTILKVNESTLRAWDDYIEEKDAV